jgi:hypothetical protein
MATARAASLQQWTRSMATGMALPYISSVLLLLGNDHEAAAYVFKLCV